MGIDLSGLITPADKLVELKAEASDRIRAACRAEITSGFVSSALGEPHTYPTGETDQANLASSVIDSLLTDDPEWRTPFWCADDEGAWEFRMHTRVQIQQVGREAKAAVLDCMARNEALQSEIQMASTRVDVESITWQTAE